MTVDTALKLPGWKKGLQAIRIRLKISSGQFVSGQASDEISGQPIKIGNKVKQYGQRLNGVGFNMSLEINKSGMDAIPFQPISFDMANGRNKKFDVALLPVVVDRAEISITPFKELVGFEWQKFFSYIKEIDWPAQGQQDWYSPKFQKALQQKLNASTRQGRAATHVYQQSGDSFSPVFELIDNAIDAIFRKLGIPMSLGQFGEGGLQVLSYLREDLRLVNGVYQGDFVMWTSSTPEDGAKKARRLMFYLKDGKIQLSFEEVLGDFEPGTIIEVRSSRFDRQKMVDLGHGEERLDPDVLSREIKDKYGASDQVRLFLDDVLVNERPEDSLFIGQSGLKGRYLVDDERNVVYAKIFKDGFSIRDPAKGMSDQIILTKLPRPRSGENTQDKREAMQLANKVEETSELEISAKNTLERMTVNVLVGSRRMFSMEVPAEGVVLPESMDVRLPSTTKLTDDKNDIVVDDTVESAVDFLTKSLFDALADSTDMGYVLPKINGMVAVMERFKRKKISANGHDFITDFIAQAKKILLPYIKQGQGQVFLLPAIPGLQEASVAVNSRVILLNEVFFRDSLDLLDAMMPRSNVFAGQRVYVLPDGVISRPVPFREDVLFITADEENKIWSSSNYEEAVRLFNIALEENNLGRFHAPVTKVTGKDDARMAVLERITGENADEKNKLMSNLSGASISVDGLNRAISAFDADPLLVQEDGNDQKDFEVMDDPKTGGFDYDTYLKQGYTLYPDALLDDDNVALYLGNHMFVVHRPSGTVVFDSNDMIVPAEKGKIVKVMDDTYTRPWEIHPAVPVNKYYRYPYRFITRVMNSTEEDSIGNIFHSENNHGKFYMKLEAELPLKGWRGAFGKDLKTAGVGLVWGAAAMSIGLMTVSGLAGLGVWFSQNGLLMWLAVVVADLFLRMVNSMFKGEEFSGLKERLFNEGVSALAAGSGIPLLLDLLGGHVNLNTAGVFILAAALWGMKVNYGEKIFGRDKNAFKNGILGIFRGKQGKIPGFIDIEMEGMDRILFDLKNRRWHKLPASADQVLTGPDGIVYFEDSGDVKIVDPRTGPSKVKTLIKLGRKEKVMGIEVSQDRVFALAQEIRKNKEVRTFLYEYSGGRVNTIPVADWGREKVTLIKGWKGGAYFIVDDVLKCFDPRTNEIRTIKIFSAESNGQQFYDTYTRLFFDTDGRFILFRGSWQVLDKETGKMVDLTKTFPWLSDAPEHPVILGEEYILVPPRDGKGPWKKLIPGDNGVLRQDAGDMDEQLLQKNARQARLLENLKSLSSELLTDELAPLLPYASAQIITKLSEKTRADLLGSIAGADMNGRARIFDFFEKAAPALGSLSTASLNVVVNNWIMLLRTGDAPFAAQFLKALSGEYAIGGGLFVNGAELLKNAAYAAQVPAQLKDLWIGLFQQDEEKIPEEVQVSRFLPHGTVIRRLSPVSLAEILSVRNSSVFDLDLEALQTGLEKNKKISPSIKSGYDQEIFSAVQGQDATTLLRELVQNARDIMLKKKLAPGERPRADVRIYSVQRADGKYELVTEVRDTGDGMNDQLLINKLLPLDETSKKRHMGQGFYTIWAETNPGDRIEIESRAAHTLERGVMPGHGFVFVASKGVDKTIAVDELQEVEFGESGEGVPVSGTAVRQIRVFDSLNELKQQAHRLNTRLKYYCGAVNDVDIFLNDERINEETELLASLRFGDEFSSSDLYMRKGGGTSNRILQDQLAMPASLDVSREKYWDPAIPSEFQDMLLSWGVNTQIADGILLTKARTEPAYPAFLSLIHQSEGLKAMLAGAGHFSSIKDLKVLGKIKEALAKADEDDKRDPELRIMASYLNYEDPQQGGQRNFHKVPEAYMKENFYRLLIRLQLNAPEGKKTLLGINRGKESVEIVPQVDEPFVLPRQYEDGPSKLEFKPKNVKKVFFEQLDNIIARPLRKMLQFIVLVYIGIAVPAKSVQIFNQYQDVRKEILLRDGHQASNIPPTEKGAVILARADGLRPGEYLIRDFRYFDGNGKATTYQSMEPQGELTGEEVKITTMLEGHIKGDWISVPQVVNGVLEEIREASVSLDHFSVMAGGIYCEKDIPAGTTITYVIPRHNKNNRLRSVPKLAVGDRESLSIEQQPELMAKINEVKAQNLPQAEELRAIAGILKYFIAYDDTKGISRGAGTWTDSWMNINRNLENDGNEVDGHRMALGKCTDIALMQQFLLKYFGYVALDASVYVYGGENVISSNTGHADSYIVMTDGTLVEASWGNGGIYVNNVSGFYGVPNEPQSATAGGVIVGSGSVLGGLVGYSQEGDESVEQYGDPKLSDGATFSWSDSMNTPGGIAILSLFGLMGLAVIGLGARSVILLDKDKKVREGSESEKEVHVPKEAVVEAPFDQEDLQRALEGVGDKVSSRDEGIAQGAGDTDLVVMQKNIAMVRPGLNAYMQRMLPGVDLVGVDIRINEEKDARQVRYQDDVLLIGQNYYYQSIKPLAEAFDPRNVQSQAYQQARFKVAAELAWVLFSHDLSFDKRGNEERLSFYTASVLRLIDEVKLEDKVEAVDAADDAHAKDNAEYGGIDFNPAQMNMSIKGDGSAAVNAFDPAMFEQLQNAQGFMPVILNISPVPDLSQFFGISS